MTRMGGCGGGGSSLGRELGCSEVQATKARAAAMRVGDELKRCIIRPLIDAILLKHLTTQHHLVKQVCIRLGYSSLVVRKIVFI
mgnify:CR=1 FL=1